jgi:hypothetical protein
VLARKSARKRVSTRPLTLVAAVAPLVLLVLLGASGCASPFRGDWSGTFDGTVTGTVSFEINTRGSALRGRMEGHTSDGQPFEAELEGNLAYGQVDASFRGTSQSDFGVPLIFEGQMRGQLEGDAGAGGWEATLLAARAPMAGTWTVARVLAPGSL